MTTAPHPLDEAIAVLGDIVFGRIAGAESQAAALRVLRAARDCDNIAIPMTDVDLDEIERVWAKATPGPWGAKQFDKYTVDCGKITTNSYNCVCSTRDHCAEGLRQDARNAKAIASAPAHIAALVAEVRRLRERALYPPPKEVDR